METRLSDSFLKSNLKELIFVRDSVEIEVIDHQFRFRTVNILQRIAWTRYIFFAYPKRATKKKAAKNMYISQPLFLSLELKTELIRSKIPTITSRLLISNLKIWWWQWRLKATYKKLGVPGGKRHFEVNKRTSCVAQPVTITSFISWKMRHAAQGSCEFMCTRIQTLEYKPDFKHKNQEKCDLYLADYYNSSFVFQCHCYCPSSQSA